MSRPVRLVSVLVALFVSLTSPVLVTSPAGAAPAVTTARPTLTGVSPSSGAVAGGQQVTLSGTGLATTDVVRFGSTDAAIVDKTDESVVVTTPASSKPRSVLVRVHTAGGWSETTPQARFVYLRPAGPAPTLRRLSPTTGSYVGGERVTIYGLRLSKATSVSFGTEPAEIVSRTKRSVVVTTPIGVLGATDVTVTSADGTSRPLSFTYVEPAASQSVDIDPATDVFEPASIQWVSGGYDVDTDSTKPWVVSLPPGSATPTVGQQLLVRPGGSTYPSGLAGTVEDVASQTDESVRVTVTPTQDLTKALDQASVGFTGSLVSAPRGRSLSSDNAVEFPINGSALFCHDQQGRSVSFHADLSMSVTDLDVSQHLDIGGLFSDTTYDSTVTAEVLTTGKFYGEVASTCEIKAEWARSMTRIVPVGTSGFTVAIAPAFEFEVSARGTFTFLNRTRTTFAVDATLGDGVDFSRTSRTVERSVGGALTFEAGLYGGVELRFGFLDRVGVRGTVQLGVTASVTASGTSSGDGVEGNVCVSAQVVLELAVGLYFDVWVASWESPELTATITLFTLADFCTAADPETPPGDEPVITTTRLPDARSGSSYDGVLETEDGRAGQWRIIGGDLPEGLSLDASTGRVTGTPTDDGIGDHPLTIDFTDEAGQVETTVVRIRVQPGNGIGGGDVQVTLRWTGPSDLDLHVQEPSGEEVYYGHTVSSTGGTLDHDANAGCNGPADDDNAVENIYWPSESAPGGDYVAWVRTYNPCAADDLSWHLTVRRNGVVVVDETGSGTSPGYSFTVAGGTGGGTGGGGGGGGGTGGGGDGDGDGGGGGTNTLTGRSTAVHVVPRPTSAKPYPVKKRVKSGR